MKTILAGVCLAAASFGAVAAHAENKVGSAVTDVKEKLFQWMDKHSVSVNFDKGSAVVSDGQRSDLKALVEAARTDGAISKIIVAAWSDKDYPARGEQLTDLDRKLASEREKSVATVLLQLGVKDVETHSMAEYPTWISKTFNTRDAKVKGTGQVNDADDALALEIGKKMRDKGGAEKAVVYVQREGELAAH
jgi:hypothetical protein